MVDIADIEKAALRLDGVSIRTPLLQNFDLDQMADGRVLIKPESLQVTGSFKIRGAYNRLSQLTAAEAANGVVAWSSGNHAQGIAAAGAMLDIQTAMMPPRRKSTTRAGSAAKLLVTTATQATEKL
jgi:threonine dehydratase